VQVDFAVASPRLNGVPFLDSFAGFGSTSEEAEKDAFAKFLTGSFHVIVESLTTHTCDEKQVEWVTWSGSGARWRTCEGPLITNSTHADAKVRGYSEFFPRLVRALESNLPSGPHWVRVFVAGLQGRIVGSEVLVDGEPWAPGEAMLAAHPWVLPESYSSLRQLNIALPERA
jgi:hypothetical protein